MQCKPVKQEPVKDFNDEVPGIFSHYGVFNKKVKVLFLLSKCIIWDDIIHACAVCFSS